MSIVQKFIYAASPATERGQPTPLSADSKGQRIAYASNKSIFVRSIDHPEQATQYTAHTAQTTVARFSSSGFFIASGDASGIVRVWDCVGEGATKGEYGIIAGRINDIAWDGDSQRIIAVGNGRERFGHCITADSGNSVGEISGHSAQINAVSIKPQRPMRAATAGDDTSLVFYTGPPFKFSTSARGKHNRFIYGTAFSPDGNYLVSVGADRKIWLYDGKTGESVKELGSDEHKGSIFGMSWAGDSKRFATCSADQTVKTWDVESGKVLQSWRLGEDGVVSVQDQQVGVVWVPGRQDDLIISVDLEGNLSYLQPSSQKPTRVVHGHQKNITSLAADAQKAYTGSVEGRVRTWDVAKGVASPIDGKGHANYIAGLAAVPGTTRIQSCAWDDTLRAIDTTSDAFLGSSSKVPAQPRGIAVSASKHSLVITPNAIEVFAPDGKFVSTIATAHAPTAIAASPTGDIVAVSDDTKALRIYRLSSSGALGQASTPSTSFPAVPSTLSFSPSSKHLAVGLADGKIHVLNTADWSVATTRWSAHSARVTSLSWRASGTHAISGSLDTHVNIWSLSEPGLRLRAANAHKDGVNAVAWLDGQDQVLSTGADATVKVWSVEGLK